MVSDDRAAVCAGLAALAGVGEAADCGGADWVAGAGAAGGAAVAAVVAVVAAGAAGFAGASALAAPSGLLAVPVEAVGPDAGVLDDAEGDAVFCVVEVAARAAAVVGAG